MLDPRSIAIAKSIQDALLTEIARHEESIRENKIDEITNSAEANEVASILISDSRERLLKFILENFHPRQ